MDYREISGDRQYRFMEELSYIRSAGTAAEARAAGQIAAAVENLGLAPRMEGFSFPAYQAEEAKLTVTAPYRKALPCAIVENSGSTGRKGIDAPLFYAEDGDDISLRSAHGKLVMLNPRVDAKLYQSLVQAGAVGFVTICGSPLDLPEDRVPVSYRLRGVPQRKASIAELQGLVIHYQDAADLLKHAASEVHFLVRQKCVLRESCNVAVRIEGTEHPEEILTLTAHYDSVPQGPGAYDNLAGAAIIMELCRYFSLHRPRRTLEFVWFGAEEQGLKGSQAYVERHRDELDGHRFNMNVDLAGQPIGGNVLGITGGMEITELFHALLLREGIGCSFKNQIWASDSNSFAREGIPAMTMGRDGFGMHTRYDTLALISGWALERGAGLLGFLAEYLGNAERFPFDRTVPKEMLSALRCGIE